MTHPSSNDPQAGNPQNPATSDMSSSDRPLPPLPAPDRATNPRELPALPPLPALGRATEEQPILPSLPKSGGPAGGLPPLPGTTEQDEKPAFPPKAGTSDDGDKPALPALPPLPKPDGPADVLPSFPGAATQDAKPPLTPMAEMPDEEKVPALPALPVVVPTEKQPILPPLPKPGDTSDELPPLPGALDLDVKAKLPLGAETAGNGEKPALPALPVTATTEKQPVFPSLPSGLNQDVKAKLPSGTETTDNGEKPALPALPVTATPEKQPVLPPLPKLSDAATELPPLPPTLRSEGAETGTKVDLAVPSAAEVSTDGGSDIAKPVEDQEIKAVIPTASSQEGEEQQPDEDAVVAEQAVPAFTDEQKFVLSLSPHENLTVIEGCSFLTMSVAMADGEVDQREQEAHAVACEKFMGLFEGTSDLGNEQFEAKFLEQQKEIVALDTFLSKFKEAQDETETKKLVTYFMADFSRVLGKAPESVAQKIKDHVRESCLEVAEASGEDGAGANICSAEAVVIGDLLGLLEIALDEETQKRIFGSLEQKPEADSAEFESQTDSKEADLAALKTRLWEASDTLKFMDGLDTVRSVDGADLGHTKLTDFLSTLGAIPALVAAADGKIDAAEVAASEAVRGELDQLLYGIVERELQTIECDEALGNEVLGECANLTDISDDVIDARITGLINPLIGEGTALERNQKLTGLLRDFKTVLDQSPDSLQASLKEWLLESSVKVAEASGSDTEGDDKIGIEERQLLVALFRELDLDYQGTPFEERLNIDPEEQDFRGYLSTLNSEDRIRLLALPHVLVEIVAAADGKIDTQEAMAITPILKEESKAMDPEFPVIWRENLDEVKKFGKGLTGEFQDLQGTKGQLEWTFSLLDGYWKILETMPTDLQKRFRTSILNIVTEVAEVSGDGGVAGNIGVEEKLLINIICESLGIERDAVVTELEVD